MLNSNDVHGFSLSSFIAEKICGLEADGVAHRHKNFLAPENPNQKGFESHGPATPTRIECWLRTGGPSSAAGVIGSKCAANRAVVLDISETFSGIVVLPSPNVPGTMHQRQAIAIRGIKVQKREVQSVIRTPRSANIDSTIDHRSNDDILTLSYSLFN